MSSVKLVSEPFLAQISGSAGRERVDHLNAWIAALNTHGLGEGVAPVVFGEPATEREISEVEDALGFTFPPSYRRFLAEFGSIEFPSRGIRTYRVDELVAVSAELAQWIRNGSSPLAGDSDVLEVIRISARESDGDVYLAQYRDHRMEAPLLAWWHDDQFGSRTERDEILETVKASSDFLDHRGPVSESVPVVHTPLTHEISEILDGDGSQRERFASLERFRSRLDAAEDVELLNVLLAIQRAIRSPKLVAARDIFIADLRRDGEGVGARLPRLARPESASNEPRGFAAFDSWLKDQVDRFVETTLERLATSGLYQ